VSALCALYDDQAIAGLNAHPHPRGKGLKALIERLKIDWAAEKRRTFEDRAINGLNDGYTIEQAGRLCALLLRGGIEDGSQLITGPDLNLLRTRLDFLMLHSMMLRGESTRKAELADLCSVLLPDESSECLGLVLRTSAGKTVPLAVGGNPRMQQYHAACHRDPVLCPIGALAHWLVLRWEICGETPSRRARIAISEAVPRRHFVRPYGCRASGKLKYIELNKRNKRKTKDKNLP
jgi:hypothetical protein